MDAEKGAQVELTAGKRTLASLVVGKAATGGATYVRTGDRVFRVTGLYRGVFGKDASAWLERKLFVDAVTAVTRIEVRLHDAPVYALVKKEDVWALEDPSVLPAGFRFDAKAAASLVAAVVNARATDVLATPIDETTSGLGEAAEAWRYTLAAGEGGEPAVTHELRLGAEKEAGVRYARTDRRADVVTLASSTVTSLRKRPTDLRDLAVILLDATKVRALHIVDGARTLELVKKGDAWSLARTSETLPKGFELDPQAAARRVSTLASVHATRVDEGATLAASGLSRPSATVTATLEDGSQVRLAFGKDVEVEGRKEAYVLGNVDKSIYVVGSWTRTTLLGGIDTLRKKPDEDPLLNLDPKTLSGLPPEVRANLQQQIAQKRQQQEMLKRLGAGAAPAAR